MCPVSLTKTKMIDVYHEELKINLTEKVSTAKKKYQQMGTHLKM